MRMRRLKIVAPLLFVLASACGSDTAGRDGSAGGDVGGGVTRPPTTETSSIVYSCVYETRSSSSGGGVSDSGTWTTGCIEVADHSECLAETKSSRSCEGGFCFGRHYRNPKTVEGTCDALDDELTQVTTVTPPATTMPPETSAPPATTMPPETSAPPVTQTFDDDYAFVRDSTGTIGFEIPVGWSDVDTGPGVFDNGSTFPLLMAAPDLAGFNGSYEGSGVGVWYLTAEQTGYLSRADWVSEQVAGELDYCGAAEAGENEDLAWMTMSGCGAAGANLSLSVQDSSDGAHRRVIWFQWFDGFEVDYLTRVLATFVAA